MDEKIRKLNASVIRDVQKAHGAFDGRFKTVSIPSKKIYKRKAKHAKKPCD